MNRTVSKLINKYLGDWLENLDSTQLDVSLFSGKILLEKLRPKREIFQMFGLPFELKYGEIGKIKVKIPWGSLLSKPFIIEVSEIFAYVSPVDSAIWSEATLKELLEKLKKISLDQFEALHETNIGGANIPGFLRRWLTKIVENFQLTIKNIYIRYEDEITSPYSFSIGVMLEELVIDTCDSNWEKKKHKSADDVFYKLVKMKNFSVFCDYDVEMILFQKVYQGETETAFAEVAAHDISGMIQHNYILVPFSIEVQLIVSKTFEKTFPLINAQVKSEELCLNIYTGQIKACLRLLELIKLFIVFSAGIDKKINQRAFNEEESEVYQNIYIKYREAVAAEKTSRIEKLKKKLAVLEQSVSYATLTALREAVITSMTKQQLINEKLEEINKISKINKEKPSKLKRFFKNISDLEYADQSRKALDQLNTAEEELKSLLEQDVLQKKAPEKEDSDWLKIFMLASISRIVINVIHATKPLTTVCIEKLALALGLKSCVFIDLQIPNLSIMDHVGKSDFFPNFFEMGQISMYLEENPLKIKLKCGETFVYCLTDSILQISRVFKETLDKEIDISGYSVNVKEKYNEYLEAGQDYIKLLFKNKEAAVVELEVNCKAPVIILPLDSSNESNFLAINLGEIECSTCNLSKFSQEYRFDLKNFSFYIVWYCEAPKSFQSGSTDTILAPISISASLITKFVNKLPRIDLSISINEISLAINPKDLMFLSSLGSKFAQLIPTMILVQSGEEYAEDYQKIVSRPKSEAMEIPISIDIKLQMMELKVKNGKHRFFNAGVQEIKANIDVDSHGTADVLIIVKKMFVDYKKKGTAHPEIVGWPNLDNDDFQILLKINANKVSEIVDVGISVQGFRLVLYSGFAKALQDFYINNQKAFKLPDLGFSSTQHKAEYSKEVLTHLRLSINCKNFECHIPEEHNRNTLIFSLSSSLEYLCERTLRNYLSPTGLTFSTTSVSATEELHISSSHMQCILVDSSSNESTLINPFRVLLEICINTHEKFTVKQLLMNINAEPILVLASIDDVLFFERLGNDWKFMKPPVFERIDMDMRVHAEEIAIGLCDESSATLKNLLSLKIKEVSMKYAQNLIEDNIDCSLGLEVEYFNANYSHWEPLFERQALSFVLALQPKLIKAKITTIDTINLNVSYELLRIAVETIEKILQKKTETTAGSKYAESFKYLIENDLSQPLTIWVSTDESSEKWLIQPSQTQTFTDTYLEQLQSKRLLSIKQTALLMTLKPPTTLSFFFDISPTKIFHIILEETSMKIIKISPKGPQYFVNNYSEGVRRVIKFQTGIFIANNYDNPCSLRPLNEAEISNIDCVFVSETLRMLDARKNLLVKSRTGDIVVETHEFLIERNERISVIEVNPLYKLRNLLAHDVEILKDGQVVQLLPAGCSENCAFDPKQEYCIRLDGRLSKPGTIFDETHKNSRLKFQELPKSSISIRIAKNEISEYPGLGLADRKKSAKDPKLHSWVIEFYAKYIISNRSHLDLIASGLPLLRNTQVYSSKKHNKMQAMSLDESSDWSEKFQIDTIGVSGAITIPNPTKTYSLGILISQSPGYMIDTKIVTFLPRFALWNYLNFPLSLQGPTLAPTLLPALTSESTLSPQFINISSPAKLALSTNEEDWSCRFLIDKLDDFQVCVKSELDTSEKSLGLFRQEWHLPLEKNGGMRVIRVLVTTSDEATLNVCFMSPKESEYRIVNKTDEKITIKQEGALDSNLVEVGAYGSAEWTWRDFETKKKKVLVTSGEISVAYSLDKIKSYDKKPLKDATVAVVVNGITRELWIKSKEYKEKKAARQSGQKVEKFVVLKDGDEHDIVNPRFAIQGSMAALPDIVNSLDNVLMAIVGKEIAIDISLDLHSIGLSLIDKNHKEILYTYISQVCVIGDSTIQILGNKTKVSTNLNLSIKGFQIDTTDSDPNVFPVLLCPVRSLNPLKSDKTSKDCFFMAQIDHVMIIKSYKNQTEFKHKFDNFELALQELKITVNEETIYKLINIRHFVELFSKIKSKDSNLIEKINSIGTLQKPTRSEFSAKSYFRFFKLRALKFSLTIKQASKQIDIGIFSGSVLFNAARVFAGALGTISESTFNFKEVYILNAFQSFEYFIARLAREYLSQAIIQFYKILGSIDLVGNPLNLLDTLGTAVYEFFAEPARGLLGGPKEFAKGLGRGVRSLVAGVIAGSFDSVTKISGTLYQVLRKATDDRSEQMPLTSSIPQNAWNGVKDSFIDLGSGFTQVVLRPYRGAKKNGAKGFFKGALFGSLGLVSCPIKFALKFTNTVSVSISATSILVSKGKIEKQGRTRFPRFVGPKNVLQRYSEDLAAIKELVSSLSSRVVYYSEICVEKNELFFDDCVVILVLTTEFLLYFIDGKIFKKVSVQDIVHSQLHCYNRLYYLCVASDKENFAVPSRYFKSLYTLFRMICIVNPSLSISEEFKFECPKYLDLKALKAPKMN